MSTIIFCGILRPLGTRKIIYNVLGPPAISGHHLEIFKKAKKNASKPHFVISKNSTGRKIYLGIIITHMSIRTYWGISGNLFRMFYDLRPSPDTILKFSDSQKTLQNRIFLTLISKIFLAVIIITWSILIHWGTAGKLFGTFWDLPAVSSH